MLKKILAVLLALLLAVSFAACARSGESVPSLAMPEEGAAWPAVSDEDYPDTLNGLCEYLEAAGVVAYTTSSATESSAASIERTEMSYQEIGADGGYRYRFTYNGSTVQVEVYHFNTEDLNEKGKACLKDAEEKGEITVLDNNIPVLLHPTKRYLLIYSDTSEKEENLALRSHTEELFKAFMAK